MKKMSAVAIVVAACVVVPALQASDEGSGDPPPEREVIKSAVVIDCGQWPIEHDQELATRFRQNCQSNSKSMGYVQAWTLTEANVPQAALDHPRSFRCKAVAENNTGYYCLAVKTP